MLNVLRIRCPACHHASLSAAIPTSRQVLLLPLARSGGAAGWAARSGRKLTGRLTIPARPRQGYPSWDGGASRSRTREGTRSKACDESSLSTLFDLGLPGRVSLGWHSAGRHGHPHGGQAIATIGVPRVSLLMPVDKGSGLQTPDHRKRDAAPRPGAGAVSEVGGMGLTWLPIPS